MTNDMLKKKFEETYGGRPDVQIFSAPGRVELGGNHTDHQHGCVLAASINLDMRAAAAKSGNNTIRVLSEGYPELKIDISDTKPRECEKNTTPALVRGIANALKMRGAALCGVDMYITSNVLKGSGLSSSAAFEVLIARVLSDMSGAGLSAVDAAKTGQYAEREYFGKPCGLMDQTACSVGGVCAIDFKGKEPEIRKIECDLKAFGYDLVIVNAGADHANLTGEYAAIPQEMKSVAALCGKEFLADVKKEDFHNNIKSIREQAGDRAVLRAIHFFAETERAKKEADALVRGDFNAFLTLVSESGRSSFMYLQNVYPSGSIKHQAMAYTLAVCEELLCGRGAVRLQGGGFGGTVEAFVPCNMTDAFVSGIEKFLGKDMCRVLTFTNSGAVRVM